tara:strand:- start:1061 stop:1264 length:204 start_codon:yes stop_codon:yes gene_type:complete
MSGAVAKVLVNAMRKNRMSVIKYYASKMGMSRGKLLSTAKKVNRKSPKAKKMSKGESNARTRQGQIV